MIDINFNAFQWYDSFDAPTKKSIPESPTTEKKQERPAKFEAEIKALCAYAGVDELKPGSEINITLTEILDIIPKTRRRKDSYNMLVKYLHDELSVELIIKSRKHEKTKEVQQI